jgi:pilus assembly protein FimV
VHNSKLKRMTVALCMALVPISVFAAGLGKLNVMSGLGEPLKADIELIAVTPEELSSITAAIASQEDYATQGIEKPASHNTINVEVAKNASGTPILKLKSAQPISEPFLDMLIRVDWASGRLLREYTVLLDPPGYTGEADTRAQTAQAPIVATKGSTQKRMNQDPIKASQDNSMMDETGSVAPTKKSSKHKKVKAAEMPAGTSETEVTGQDYTTHRGDTLSKIAREIKPEGVSLEQMLVGLYQANPDAFEGDNMNRLKVGRIIRQPSQEALNAISHGEARKEIKVQSANWNTYRNKLATIVAKSAPQEDTEANSQSAGGKIKTAAEDKSVSAATGPKDVVKLSTGDASVSKADMSNIKILQDKITALQEEATAREKSVKEAQSRTADLEKQIADMQKLLALKNGAMADLQAQAQKDTDTKTTEQNKPAEAKPEPMPAPAVEAKSEPTPVPATVAGNKPVVKPAIVPAPQPVEEPGFISSLLGGLDVGLLAPLGGALALLGGGWFYLRKKREKSLADFEQGIMTSGGLKANTVFGNTANSNVETGDTSFLTDFSQSANGGMIDTNDVDPIAEAEVYMAYGRDAQAEEILKDAIAKEPKRHELHLKLLEMYAASKSLSAFETIAGELYTSLGAEDPTWAKVADIGIKLEPNNPLYQANSQPPGMGEKLDASDFSDSPLAAEKDLDFSFDNDALTQGFAPTGVELNKPVATETRVADFDGLAKSVKAPVATVGALAATGLTVESFMSNAKPEIANVDSFAANNLVADNMLEFDMAELGGASHELPVETTVLVGNIEQSMPSMDIPTFSEPQFMPEALQADVQAEFDTDFTEFKTSFPNTMTPAETVVLDTSSFNTSNDTADEAAAFNTSFAESNLATDTDFNFDITSPTDQSADSLAFKDADFADANSFDLTTINLDMDEASDAVKANASTAKIIHDVPSSGAEPIEVDTKLDLVAAYIEMDDKEGAKELLAEVMKEGSASQRQRAEALLTKLA